LKENATKNISDPNTVRDINNNVDALLSQRKEELDDPTPENFLKHLQVQTRALLDDLEALTTERGVPDDSSASFEGDDDSKKKQEQIERALKPIIEQLLRGKYGEEELYY